MSEIKSFVDRIESMDSEIAERNEDKRSIYAEAKAFGLDVKALKAVIAIRRKDPNKLKEHEAIVETYLAELRGTVSATRMQVREPIKSVEDWPEIPEELRRRPAVPATGAA